MRRARTPNFFYSAVHGLEAVSGLGKRVGEVRVTGGAVDSLACGQLAIRLFHDFKAVFYIERLLDLVIVEYKRHETS